VETVEALSVEALVASEVLALEEVSVAEA